MRENNREEKYVERDNEDGIPPAECQYGSRREISQARTC